MIVRVSKQELAIFRHDWPESGLPEGPVVFEFADWGGIMGIVPSALLDKINTLDALLVLAELAYAGQIGRREAA